MNLTCKDCSQDGFTSPYHLRKHKIADHGAAPMKPMGGAHRNRANAVVVVAAGPDVEAQLLTKAIDLFANAGTDRGADQRVLEYLGKRFGPDAYVDED